MATVSGAGPNSRSPTSHHTGRHRPNVRDRWHYVLGGPVLGQLSASNWGRTSILRASVTRMSSSLCRANAHPQLPFVKRFLFLILNLIFIQTRTFFWLKRVENRLMFHAIFGMYEGKSALYMIMTLMNCTQEVSYHNLEYLHLYFTNKSSTNGKPVSICEDVRMSFLRSVIILEMIIIFILLATLVILSYRKVCVYYHLQSQAIHGDAHKVWFMREYSLSRKRKWRATK